MAARSWEEVFTEERRLAAVRPQTWDTVEKRLENIKPTIEDTIIKSGADIQKYPHSNDDGEKLSQLLANLNWYVLRLGELQPVAEQLKNWTDKRYEIEKGLETVRIVKEDQKATNYAQNAKYQKVKDFLDIMVQSAALHMRVQNARSSARDTTEAIRSRIGQLRGSQRSS